MQINTMQFSQKTIIEFFDSSQKSFHIPVYQRAYSWEEKEWRTFLNDLNESINGNNNYFYGNILLEIRKKGVEYEIIDGQQRLTTLSIFIRSLLDILDSRVKNGEKLDFKIKEKEKIYFKNNGNKKIRPVDYDRACFDTLIIDGKDNFETNSPSQNRIKDAKVFFKETLKKLPTHLIIKILEKIENTELTCIELIGKKDSALMFELQNNRGKDLTNMEKIKSYFMYQLYVNSNEKETESNIEHVTNIFKSIYLIINDLKIKEDSVLLYHCNAYLGGYEYNIDSIKLALKKSNDKIYWINNFTEELRTTFYNLKKFENTNDLYLNLLKKLGISAYIYPFIIKGYKYIGNNTKKLTDLFHILEIVIFRDDLVNTRADIYSRINEILNKFDGDLEILKQHFKTKFNESYYWGDNRINEILKSGWMYDNKVIKYILWRYEDNLLRTGYKIGNCEITGESIEHISPQNPFNRYQVSDDYEVNEKHSYEQNFIDNYLNCIGNLVLISRSHNSSIGNKPFKEKLDSYIANPILKQQLEIKEFISGDNNNPKWDSVAIKKRKEKIVKFALQNWSFDNVYIS
ncbi:MAG: DUF262 domain-containing HNH endonuclease family protein [Bacteroidota bacterium]